MLRNNSERIRKLEEALAIAERVKNPFLAENIRKALKEALKEI
jgi:hypothetical protein